MRTPLAGLALLLLLALAPLARAASAVSLVWDAGAACPGCATPEGYVLYRHDATSSTFVEVGRMPLATRTFTDTPPVGQTYTYVVRSYAGKLVSDPSNEVVVPLPAAPGAPKNLVVTVTVTVTGAP